MGAPGFDVETISRGLAFADAVDDLAAAVRPAGANVVVVAPPGTGKTTVVPAVLADAVRGRVIVTQPRRIAVRAAARRLAQLDRTQLGTRVGFSVRGERVLGPAARVEFVTPGLLLRRLLADPELDGVSAVVLDEVHERQLDTDLLLALLADLRALREDLTAVVMSATLDAERYADLLETTGRPARVVRVEAPAHPLTVRWEPCPTPRLDARGVSRAFLDHVAGSAARAHSQELAADATTDALVFLPGAAEVDHVVAALSRLAPKTEVLALHGRVDAAAQDRAISGRRHDQPPRIVVSTALAESSLTVPGVRLVVDAGLAREPRVDRARAMAGLITLACSKATAVQRAGRATRQAPGVVVRCYEERTHAGAADHLTPEIVSSELSAAMLLLAAWGTPGGNGLRWLDPPPAAAVADATAVLRSLGAVDAEGRITQVGRRLVAMPLDPRWGSALLEAARSYGASRAAEVVAAASGDFRPRGGDLGGLLRSLRAGRHPQTAAWRREATRLGHVAAGEAKAASLAGTSADALALAVATAWPERVARRVEGTTYELAHGTRAALPSDSPLLGEEWLAVAAVDRAEGRTAAGTGAVIRAAVSLPDELVRTSPLLRDRTTAEFVDGRIRGRQVRSLGAIVLAVTPVRLGAAEGGQAVAEALNRDGLGMLTFSPAADALRRRLAFLHREVAAPWPAVDDAALLGRWQQWLAPELQRLAEGESVGRLDLLDAVRRLLPWPEAGRLEELAPAELPVPSGRRVRVRYPGVGEGGPPVVEVKLQECFGLAVSPRIVGVPVLFHLLSPAGRPVAVTDDLASFWSGAYAQVRAEMRGRYPRHPWPEDPWTSPATRGTKHPRGSRGG